MPLWLLTGPNFRTESKFSEYIELLSPLQDKIPTHVLPNYRYEVKVA
jgi:hypothetical protein